MPSISARFRPFHAAVVLAILLNSGCARKDEKPQEISGVPAFSGDSSLPKIVVLSTGGTIATRQDGKTGQPLPALTGAELVNAVPELRSVAQVAVVEVSQVGSSDMTPAIWKDLLRRINQSLARSDVASVVVTHGTDTLEETAFFLDLTVASQKPVVITGAQRMASDPEPDGPANLLAAVRVAASKEASGKGVLVVLHDEINAAREVTKTSTTELDTFKSLVNGPIGRIDHGSVRFLREPSRRVTIPFNPDTELPRVEIVGHYAGADGWLIKNLLGVSILPGSPHLDGLVIAATGMGHVSAAMYDEIARVREKGIPVVIATRVFTGPTTPKYHGKGLGSSLKDIGCIFVKDLSPQKARVLLMVSLTQTHDATQLQRYFD